MTHALAPLYAVVHFETAAGRTVRRIVVPFPDAKTADLFAIENGYGDYAVAPMATINPAWSEWERR